MLATPSTSHVSFDRIYEPAEDSFLLLDTLSASSEVEFLKQRFADHVPLVAEVGVGSGVVLAFVNAHASSIFGKSDIMTLAIDITHHACVATQETIEKARVDLAPKKSDTGTFLDSIQADLTSSIIADSVDVLIFNPPYVPSEESPSDLREVAHEEKSQTTSASAQFERDSKLLALSYAGGVDGMETTTRLLADLPRFLNRDHGVAYILLCAQNKPNQIIDLIKSWGPEWKVLIAGHSGKKAGWEVLQILRIWR